MKNKLTILSLSICLNIAAFANNITITNIVVNQSTQNITFTVSCNNSWYNTAAPANWDAACILVKRRFCGDGDGISYNQGVLSTPTVGNKAANDKYFKRLINNFLPKLNLATKTQRHKGKCVAFFILRAFVPSWQNSFRSEAEKKKFFLSLATCPDFSGRA